MSEQTYTAQAEEAIIVESESLEAEDISPFKDLKMAWENAIEEEIDDSDWYDEPNFLEDCLNSVGEALNTSVDWIKNNPGKATVGAIGLAGLVYAGIKLFSDNE